MGTPFGDSRAFVWSPRLVEERGENACPVPSSPEQWLPSFPPSPSPSQGRVVVFL
jgi:hypothetical protein